MKAAVLRSSIAGLLDRLRKAGVSAICLLALCAHLLSGCAGGSGSSGFITENAAITAALEEQTCVDFEGLVICAARIATPERSPVPGPPTPTPTVAPLPSGEIITLDLGRNETESIGCPLIAVDRCALSLPFMASGFPPEAIFVIATRITEQSFWMLSLATPIDGDGTQPNFDAYIPLDLSSVPEPPRLSVQFAVLVFFTPPERLPANVARLADTGADFAYVSESLPLSTF